MKNELWKMSSDGINTQQVTHISLQGNDPSWSPDGDKLVFVGCKEFCNLYKIKADGNGLVQLTFGDFHDWNPDWGALGIVFASNREGSEGLWFINPDGSGMRSLTLPDAVGDLDPRWDSISNHIVFARCGASEDIGCNIWDVDILGNTKQLTQIKGFLVNIDIKPGSFPNSIQLASSGTTTVAIFSTPIFDATTIDPTTVTLAGASVKLKGKSTPMASFEDINKDSLLDLVVHVNTEALELTIADTEAILTGQTSEGVWIQGSDSIRIVP